MKTQNFAANKQMPPISGLPADAMPANNLPGLLPGLNTLQELSLGDGRICIAVVDGMVDLQHSCFNGAQLQQEVPAGRESASNNITTSAAVMHGTHVASIIFAQHAGANDAGANVNTNSPLQGIAPRCCGVSVPIFFNREDGSGEPCTQQTLAAALRRAADAGAHVINISGGELSPSGTVTQELKDSIKYCADRGALIVAAAGNEGCACVHVPASEPLVLAVGAMDSEGRPLDHSNWGAAYQQQAILAPGNKIAGALPGNRAARHSGTSFAAPIVSGVIGLLLSLQIRNGKTPDPFAIRDLLIQTAFACSPLEVSNTRRCLAGRINIPAALQGTLHLQESRAQAAEPQSLPADTKLFCDMLNTTQNTSAPNGQFKHKLTWRNQMQEIQTQNEFAEPASTANSSSQALNLSAPVQATPQNLEQDATSSTEFVPSSAAYIPQESLNQLELSACACGGNKEESAPAAAASAPSQSLGFVIGSLGYDFGSQPRLDSFMQAQGKQWDPFNASELLGFLSTNDDDVTDFSYQAENIHWTINHETTPLFVISPLGAFADRAYKLLLRFLRDAIETGSAHRISIPGIVTGEARLQSGQVVPRIVPDIRGAYSWTTKKMVEAVNAGAAKGKANADDESLDGLPNFLNKVYYELRNDGVHPSDRALNFLATKAFSVGGVFDRMYSENLNLLDISATKSPHCRPESECIDVNLRFFDADNLNKAKRVFRLTVDVSDVIPVAVGEIRSWNEF